MHKQKQLARLIVSGSFNKNNLRANSPQPSVYNTLDKDETEEAKINKIIQDKYRTFTKWNLRKSLPQSPRKKELVQADNSSKQLSNNSSLALNFSVIAGKRKEDKKGLQNSKEDKNISNRYSGKKIVKLQSIKKNPNEKILKRNISPKPSKFSNQQIQNQKVKNALSSEQLGIRSDRRERFKKLRNPTLLIKHYMQKQNYNPSPQQRQLIEKLVSIQKQLDHQEPDLELILKKIYKLMNLTVDYNELKFLALIILLAADICFYLKDFSRAFYFYNQTRIAGSYAHLDNLKISALIGMAKIAFQLQYYEESSRIFRKTLQYAWRARDEDTELQIYDWLGQTLHLEGKTRDSHYYHTRFSHNQLQQSNSALKRISKQMLDEYERYIFSLEDSNLDSLFIEYLNLPISKQCEGGNSPKKQFRNYKNGQSPRMSKNKSAMNYQQFQDIKTQINIFLTEDYQFKTQISYPDTHQNFRLVKKYGKHKNEIDFQHSLEFNKIIGFKQQKLNVQQALKLPLDLKVKKMLEDRLDPQWWENMVKQARQKRSEKVGALKQRVRNSHMSSHKYPNERKRQSLWSTDQINQSFNRTLLDWIDPNVPQNENK